ncbi:hypothetical protein NUW54_g9484 [Trametes sanguinea]|uniref:Uncharacterized protein n=1 Tax=Trametes sanguinea TaxID=158606 RepID=A0ACC1P5L3_9APHY|nr:hypothetical protein NUW54_g9484 [Trametes sanguinea]
MRSNHVAFDARMLPEARAIGLEFLEQPTACTVDERVFVHPPLSEALLARHVPNTPARTPLCLARTASHPRVKSDPFPPDSAIGKWRDEMLSKPNAPAGKHIGEDFFYVQDMREKSGISLGVADGVGGWVESGVDPSLFSQALMYHAHRYSKAAWPGEPEVDPTQEYEEREQVEGWELTPLECLESAYGGVLRERAVLAGSSTACVMTLNASNGILRAANLGDSGFLVIRASSVIHQQRSQTHFFNCPKQLSKLPTSQKRFSRACVDQPSDADLHEMKLRHGDIIIAYTDGLSDNVFPAEMVAICSLVARQSQLQRRTIPVTGERSGEQTVEDIERSRPWQSA